jgi:hypothetical protein
MDERALLGGGFVRKAAVAVLCVPLFPVVTLFEIYAAYENDELTQYRFKAKAADYWREVMDELKTKRRRY